MCNGKRETRISALRDIWSKHCDGVSEQQKVRLWELMEDFKDIFALNENEVGLTHLVQHVVDTGDARPIRVRPRRLPLAQQQSADKGFEEVLQAGIVEPSESLWASAVVMVPRKNISRWRFCIDYRQLNKVTKKINIPYLE